MPPCPLFWVRKVRPFWNFPPPIAKSTPCVQAISHNFFWNSLQVIDTNVFKQMVSGVLFAEGLQGPGGEGHSRFVGGDVG